MKKVLAFLILLVYFTVSTGFVVSLHYCMDRLDSAQLGRSSSPTCNKCGMHKGKGCCHDDVKVVKLQQAHMAAAVFMAAPAAVCPAAETFLYQPALLPVQTAVRPQVHGPPRGQPPAYLLHRVFLI